MEQASRANVSFGDGQRVTVTWWYDPDDQWFYVDRGNGTGAVKEISATQMITVVNSTPEDHKHTPLSEGIFNYIKENLL